VSNWISVENGLPDFEEQVLVYLEATDLQKETDKEICHILTAARYNAGFRISTWYDFQSDVDIDEDLTKVTHWMSLPEGPKQ
jgi:2-phospho-L-lactate guanylyltransferase (CobY/MobA/RfbA family)